MSHGSHEIMISIWQTPRSKLETKEPKPAHHLTFAFFLLLTHLYTHRVGLEFYDSLESYFLDDAWKQPMK